MIVFPGRFAANLFPFDNVGWYSTKVPSHGLGRIAYITATTPPAAIRGSKLMSRALNEDAI